MIDEARENIVESRRDIIRKKKRDGKKLGRKEGNRNRNRNRNINRNRNRSARQVAVWNRRSSVCVR